MGSLSHHRTLFHPGIGRDINLSNCKGRCHVWKMIYSGIGIRNVLIFVLVADVLGVLRGILFALSVTEWVILGGYADNVIEPHVYHPPRLDSHHQGHHQAPPITPS